MNDADITGDEKKRGTKRAYKTKNVDKRSRKVHYVLAIFMEHNNAHIYVPYFQTFSNYFHFCRKARVRIFEIRK